MFDEILQHPELFGLCRQTCEENDVCIEFSEKLVESQYVILKLDAYYSSSNMHNPPPSVDCLIIVQCDTNPGYDFYLVELKNIQSPKHFEIKHIRDKFATAIEDFLKKRFAQIFLKEAYCINEFKLYFVSDACRLKKIPQFTEETYQNKLLSAKYKAFTRLEPFEFRGKKALIRPLLPNPMVTEC